MFKSLRYKLFFFTCLLIISVATTTYFIINKEYTYATITGIVTLIILNTIRLHYRKFSQNITFLLDALDNEDYMFEFTEIYLSKREKELNILLNRVKKILYKIRNEIIENERFLGIIIESVSTGIVIMNDYGHITTVNRSALELLGLPVFTHINQLSVIDETYPLLFRNMNSNNIYQISIATESEEKQVSIRISNVKLKNEILKIITLNNIVSELEEKEMESWIRLIRIMTHEIMNSVAPINSLSETLLETLNGPESFIDEQNQINALEAFETINTTAKGLLAFVESYRKFAKLPNPEFRSFYIKPFIEKIINLELKAIREKNIKVEIISSENDIKVSADENLITQVLLNIIKNAIESVKSDKNNKIIIYIYINTAGKVAVDISNNGEPIPKEVLPNIFIPFFTTKETGTGIGLSISRYIMRLHSGKLTHSISSEGYTVFGLIF